jgi:hypothetical protein
MAISKAKRSVPLAQPEPQRRSPNPEQILRPKNGLRISPAGSDARKAAQPQRRSSNPEQILRPNTRLRISPTGSRANARKAAQPAELMPVKPHVYYAIAELNAGLEKAIHNLQMLQSNQLFGASGLTAMNHVLRGIRARANRQFMMSLNERESANADHFERLCSQREKTGS